ncbi:hypothetical protein CY35_08G060100 [Sphagnum magellanicum]|nr:hypothetical protein CY35_08G060100 [Sphagnum magellanicum]
MPPSVPDNFPSTPGKVKMERSNYFGRVASRWHSTASARLLSCSAILLALTLFVLFRMSLYNGADQYMTRVTPIPQAFKPDHVWETRVRQSCLPKKSEGLIVLVTGAAGFVGTHVSLALKKRGDGVLGIDNFNSYYEVSLKRARQELLEKQEIFIIEDDINNKELLKVLFDLIQFTHLMHLAAQAGVRYAMQNPGSYVHSNIAGFVTLLEACKDANPQPAIVWASSSSVYGLNSKVPFSENDRTDQPASLYAATKKAGKSTGSGGKKKGPAPLRIFNLGNTSPVTVPNLVSILEKHLKVKAKKNTIKMPRNGDVPFTHANVSLAHSQLGYNPTTNLDVGLKKFVKWYLSYHGLEPSLKSQRS